MKKYFSDSNKGFAYPKRIFLVVLDSVGVGELPDAKEYGDLGSNTMEHAAQVCGGVSLPNLERLGLGELAQLRPSIVNSPRLNPLPQGERSNERIMGCYGKMAEQSAGKDTTTGHWEMAGLIVKEAFPTYPNGFPSEIIQEFEQKIGRKTLGNKPASGTEIIKELGEEHYRTGKPIIYTSADSVFQIAAHEEIVPLSQLYEICKIARKILTGKHAVGRVIARPFVGKPGNFVRTHNRHDYALEPFGETLLDRVKASGLDCISVGKIWDIFCGRGITNHLGTGPNALMMEKILEGMNDPNFKRGLLFANLVDFDMLFNHRQDPQGFIQAMIEFDRFLPKLFESMQPEDVLMITADHGNDPTDQSTDHTREYVPILVYGQSLKSGINLGLRKTFADCGQTIAEFLGIPPLSVGESFAQNLLKARTSVS